MRSATAAIDETEAGEWLFSRGCAFGRGAVDPSGFPPGDRPEFAFVGRSNVGKSSLLNAMLRRRSLARTSSTPGRTRELNFFLLAPEAGCGGPWLVDVPGYGYARRERARIQESRDLLRTYLESRPSLRRVFVLIDARHGPKADDTSMLDELDAVAVSHQIVLTKADKTDPAGAVIAAVIAAIRERAGAAVHPDVLVTSRRRRVGLGRVRASVADMVDLAAMGYVPSPCTQAHA